MNNLNLLEQLSGVTRVGSSAVLGVIDFDHKLLVGAWCLLMLATLNLLRVCVSILLEHYFGLDKRDHKQSDGKKQQRPSEPNNTPRLQIGQVAQDGLNSRKPMDGINHSNGVGFRIAGGCAVNRKLVKASNYVVSFFYKLPIFAHKREMTPNDQKLSHGDRNLPPTCDRSANRPA